MGKRRHEWEIIAVILELCKTPILKTQVMYRANLSFTQLNRYFDYLKKETGFITIVEVGGKERWKTTSKGLRFIEAFKQLQELFK